MIVGALLALLGFALGVFGTLIGAGGGFLLVPILLLLYPHDTPDVLTSISLAVVCVNAISGSAAYARMGRIDYKSGSLFAAATVPGSIVGALTTSLIPRHAFNLILGAVVLVAAVYLFIKPTPTITAGRRWPDGWLRVVTERSGHRHEYRYPAILGVLISLVVGFLSSLLGIGGGIIHVPVLVNLFDFPVHIATATSHFTLAFMAAAGTGAHWFAGSLQAGRVRAISLAVGVVPGAQLGAKLSNKFRGPGIIRSLAVALAVVGVRLLIGVV